MARDRYKYFRIEAAELVERLVTGLSALGQDGGDEAAVRELLRVAHTLKGAAHVVKQVPIATAAHNLEEALGGYTDGAQPPGELISAMLAIADQLSSELSTLGEAAPTEATPQQDAAELAALPATARETDEPIATVRVEVEEMDRLLESVEEMSLQVFSLSEKLAALERASTLGNALAANLIRRQPERGGVLRMTDSTVPLAQELRDQVNALNRSASSELDRLHRELQRLRELASQLRLAPTRALFLPLERAVRTTAEALGKQARFELTGGAQRVDSQVIAALREALIHVVRNAVAHGIESPAERLAANKPPVGTVRLSVQSRGGRIAFHCEDDGRGMDVDSIRRVAVAKGLVSEDQSRALSDEQALALVLQPGITTRKAVGSIAGRGIGLDVLRETVARLKGTVQIFSDQRSGTRIEVVVPTSLLSASAIMIEVGGTMAALPAESVHCATRIGASQIIRTGQAESILVDSRAVPLARLADILAGTGLSTRSHEPRLAVVLRSGQKMAAIAVDRLLGVSSIVLRPLPGFVAAPAFVAGVTLDDKGDPQLVLDPQSLIEAVKPTSAVRASVESAPRLPLLVVDDSLTTRMLEQSILESAGYRVDTASSAEEALHKARNVRYGLFLVDVEMPGMDGFEFIETTRHDSSLREVPAILVTSRSSTEDRERGARVGASDYVIKSEFDQGYLLRRIEELAIT